MSKSTIPEKTVGVTLIWFDLSANIDYTPVEYKETYAFTREQLQDRLTHVNDYFIQGQTLSVNYFNPTKMRNEWIDWHHDDFAQLKKNTKDFTVQQCIDITFR